MPPKLDEAGAGWLGAAPPFGPSISTKWNLKPQLELGRAEAAPRWLGRGAQNLKPGRAYVQRYCTFARYATLNRRYSANMQQADSVDDDIREVMARSVRLVMKHTGQSASQIARAAGVAPSTVTRLLDPDGKFVPTNATVQKLGKMLREHAIDRSRNVVEAHRDMHRAQSQENLTRLQGVPLVGQIRAGAWIEQKRAVEQVSPDILPFLDRTWPAGSIVAYEMGDDASDPAIPKGAYVFVNVDDRSYDVGSGVRVLLQRRAEFRGSTKVEIALWQVERNSAGEAFFQSRADGSEFLEFEIDGSPTIKDVDRLGVCVGVYIRL